MGLILIIDDDSSVRGTMKKILEREGHEVREAEDGVVGLKLSREATPDVVVTDLLMPEKDGIETIMELRAEFPDIGILAVSGGRYGRDWGASARRPGLGRGWVAAQALHGGSIQECGRGAAAVTGASALETGHSVPDLLGRYPMSDLVVFRFQIRSRFQEALPSSLGHGQRDAGVTGTVAPEPAHACGCLTLRQRRR